MRLLSLFLVLNVGNFIHAEETMTKFKELQDFETIYGTLMPALENSQECFAMLSGVPHPLLNVVMHLKGPKAEEKVDALIAQFPSGLPVSFWVHDCNHAPELAGILTERGYARMITCPLMTWRVEPVAVPDYQIKADRSELFIDMAVATLQLGEEIKEGYAKLLDCSNIENYLIYFEGKPIGNGTMLVNGKIGGLFNIGVLPEYQKRGAGRAMTQFLMHRAGELGIEKLLLISSPEAAKLYADLGFETSFDIDLYAR